MNIDKLNANNFLVPFQDVQHLKDWVLTYLDIDLPCGYIDSDSNSSPAEWLFHAYDAYKKNTGNKVPGYIVLSSRESYKTLTEAIFAVIMMCHFGCTIAHMAAIENQAKKAVEYINTFLRKIQPMLESHGRKIEAQNTRNISIIDKDKNIAYVTIIIATLQGSNAPHTNIMCIDEVDVMRFPQAYEEAKLIPGVFNGQHPITIKTSTRKFAFGLMEKEIQNADKSGDKLLRWNILDVTEKCLPSRHRPDLPKEKRYIHPNLPLQNLSLDEFMQLNEEKRKEYSEIEAYSGCATCPLLPVCKTKLAHRPDTDIGGLYKPIDFTINQFKKTSPDMAAAQLMCWRPSASGLIYPRFDEQEIKGNTYTIAQAYTAFTGENAPPGLTLKQLTDLMILKGIKIRCGVDWGFRHCFAITVSAIMPNGEWWILDTYAVPGLEFEQMIKLAEEVRDLYQRPAKWFPDTSQPMFIKAFNTRRMPCKQFKKDVPGGIEATRGQIIDAYGRRRLKVIKHERNEFLINGFKNHHFILDAAGKPTQEPDDEEYADVMDSIRYLAQNLFAVKGKAISPPMPTEPTAMYNPSVQQPAYETWMSQKIRELTMGNSAGNKGQSPSGSVIWDISGSDDENE